MLCPKCKTDHAHRSHRHGLFEYSVAIAGYYPYRCGHCNMRFVRFRYSPLEKVASAHPGVEREIQATRLATKRKRSRREWLIYGVAVALFLVFLYYITRDQSGAATFVPAQSSIHFA